MAPGFADREVCRAFAEMLSYPGGGVGLAARACAAELAGRSPAAARLVEAFAAFAGETPRGTLEEAYTSAFDLGGAGYPYVGYHLFGESYKRSVFLVRLKEQYRACGLDLGSELPDHVAALMGLLAASEDADFAEELITDALVPALDRMLGRSKAGAAPEDGGPSGEDSMSDDGRASDEGPPPGEAPPPDEPPGRQAYRGLLRALRLALQEPPAPVAAGPAACPAGVSRPSVAP
ncbi:MAG: molecular chaperone TorD family protein [Candidatus Rokubacteria bacterium]|nr:molecular chaperone TorD family protein [Candidatus Rokubacteria bacterium]MBI3108259.1 molecular chaperone TorD family protein [Candidatus Rokubacteria bacterium]